MPEDRRHLDTARRLELVNVLLPTRLWVTDLEAGVASSLDALVALVPADAGAHRRPTLRATFLALLARVSRGHYPVAGDDIAFDEFTAIYPVGTFNEYTTWHGQRIPEYPTPGRRALTTHQRTLTVDHIPTDESYSYSPWLPYMHVGTEHAQLLPHALVADGAGAHGVPAAAGDGRRAAATASRSATSGSSRAVPCRTAART